MYLISHRGNLEGPKAEYENSIKYINHAISKGFDVEIDVWFYKNNFYLGHDEPQYLIKEDFLVNSKLWCHAKNFTALSKMKANKNIHYFWHQKDDYTLTSNNFVWCYPGKLKGKECIDVMPEIICNISEYKIKSIGVCSDFIERLK